MDSVRWTPVCREEGEEEEDGGEQVGPANHPGHLVDIAVSRTVLTMTIHRREQDCVDNDNTHSLSVDGVDGKEKGSNKGRTRAHIEATPVDFQI